MSVQVNKTDNFETDQPLVSVIMNCYNGEKYLHEAIDSVYAQTYKNWEIIFWDNQSSDQSAEIANSYNDDKLQYYYAPIHTLLYEARNYAIEKASGEFYAFLDVDDWWAPEKLEKQIPLFGDLEVGLVYGNYWLENEKRETSKVKYNNKLPTGMVLNNLLENYVVGLVTIIVRRDSFYALEKQFNPRLKIENDEAAIAAIMNALNLSYPKKIDVALPANLRGGQPESNS